MIEAVWSARSGGRPQGREPSARDAATEGSRSEALRAPGSRT